MKTFAVNGQNDLYFGKDGNIALASDAEALAQIAAQYVKTLRGELIFDVLRGTPLLDTAWAASSRLPQFEAALRQRLSSVPGVTAISTLTLRREGDTVAYDAVLKTIFGEAPLNDRL